ncbi:MAG: AAA family ATPase [Terrimicrobiaceae bacterium]
MAPLLVMLAGPNGAGKSTFHASHLSHLHLPFLNADALSLRLQIGPYEAADEIARIRERMVLERQSFITESVFSDPVGDKVDFLASASRQGFDVELIYIGLEDAGLSADRVAARVAAGGHDVPLEKIKSRYARTLANLERAIARLPRVRLYDNSSWKDPFRFLGEFRSGSLVRKGTSIPAWARPFLKRSGFTGP